MALLDPVDWSHALQPTNDSERLLFRNLSDNLIRLDCQGLPRPGLAEAWAFDRESGSWVFTLRENATSPWGSPLGATELLGILGPRLPTGDIDGLDSAAVVGDRQVRVWGDSLPFALADPALALVDSVPLDGRGSGETIRIAKNPSGAVLEFRLAANRDPRDELEGGADVLVTRNTELADYARSRPGFTIFSLPWSRVYLLLQPAGSPSLDLRSAGPQFLAGDAIAANTRSVDSLGWLNQISSCPRTPPARTPAPSSRVAYSRDDEVARNLAERAVAVAGPEKPWRTLALDPGEFLRSLTTGSEAAYVLSVPRLTHAPCRESAALPPNATVRPLIETRAQAIVRRGAPPMTVEWDGIPRLGQP